MRERWLIPILLVGCGRSNFEGSTDAPVAVDTPDAPLPRLVCSASRAMLEPVGASADLAIAATSGGFVVAWADTTGGPLHAARLDDMRRLSAGPTMLAPGPVTGVAGVADIGNLYSVVSIAGAGQTLWSVGHDLGEATLQRTETMIASREPISAGGGARALFRGSGNQLVTSYVRGDGSLGADTLFTADNPVLAVCGDDGPGHGHIVWLESNGMFSRCTASDVDYNQPTGPVVSGGQVLSDDCYEPRNANGPNPADSMFIAWRTKSRNVLARYIASTGNVDTPVSLGGRAPKIRFDGGSRFWIAWIEEQPEPELRVAWIGLDGTIERSALPGWVPAGDEAFEIVRNGLWTYLAVLSADGGLSVLALCN